MGKAPVQVFLLPFRLAPQIYVALMVWFFFITKLAKIPIVSSLGIVTIDSLWISAMLLPIMPLGIFIGKYINTRIRKDPFYAIAHVLLMILGVYLVVNALV